MRRNSSKHEQFKKSYLQRNIGDSTLNAALDTYLNFILLNVYIQDTHIHKQCNFNKKYSRAYYMNDSFAD